MARVAATPDRKRDSRVISSSATNWLMDYSDPSFAGAQQMAGSAGPSAALFGAGIDGYAPQQHAHHFVSPASLFNMGATTHEQQQQAQNVSPARQRQLSNSPSKGSLRHARSRSNLAQQQKRSCKNLQAAAGAAGAPGSTPGSPTKPHASHDAKPAAKRSRTDLRAARSEAEAQPPPLPLQHRQSYASLDQPARAQAPAQRHVEAPAVGAAWQAQLSAMSAGSSNTTATAVAAAATKMIVKLSQQASSSGGVTDAATSSAVASVADALKAAAAGGEAEVDGLPSRAIFNLTHSSHLSTISLRRDKTLTTFVMYDAALWYLLTHAGRQDLAANISDSSQGERAREAFRRWCDKSFELVSRERIKKWKPLQGMSPDLVDLLFKNASGGRFAIISLDTGKGILPPTSAYDLLLKCHSDTNHGGRDKTHGSLKHQCANVSKELVQAFIKVCPTCSTRRKRDDAGADDTVSEAAAEDATENEIPDLSSAGLEAPLRSSLPQQQLSSSVGAPPPLSLTPDQAAFLANLRAQGYALTHVGEPLLKAPARQPSHAMARAASGMSQGSSTTSGATASTDGPMTPTVEPSHANAFTWTDPSFGAMHSAPHITPTTSAASTNGSIISKALDLPLDANAETLRRYLQAAEAGCTVTAVHEGNAFEWQESGSPATEKKVRSGRPPPLNLSMLHASFSNASGPSSQGSGSGSSLGSSSTAYADSLGSATSTCTAVSEPTLQPRNTIHLPGLTLPGRFDAPASAPPTQTEFILAPSQRIHPAMYMEKRNVSSSRSPTSSSRNLAAPSAPPAQLPSFGPTYGAVFGNASLGGSGNLFDEAPIAHQTLYGAPDVRVYLDPSYGIPPDSQASDAAHGDANHRQRANAQRFDHSEPAVIKPDMLRRHSHSGQHDPVLLANGLVAHGADSDIEGSEGGGEASSTGSVIVHDLSESDSDVGSGGSSRVGSNGTRPVSPAVARQYREPPMQASPLERTAKKAAHKAKAASSGNSSLLFPIDLGSPSRCGQSQQPTRHIDFDYDLSDMQHSGADVPLSSFRQLSLSSSSIPAPDRASDSQHAPDASDMQRFELSSSSFEEYLNNCMAPII